MGTKKYIITALSAVAVTIFAFNSGYRSARNEDAEYVEHLKLKIDSLTIALVRGKSFYQNVKVYDTTYYKPVHSDTTITISY